MYGTNLCFVAGAVSFTRPGRLKWADSRAPCLSIARRRLASHQLAGAFVGIGSRSDLTQRFSQLLFISPPCWAKPWGCLRPVWRGGELHQLLSVAIPRSDAK